MGKINIIYKINACYFDEQSVITNDEDMDNYSETYFLPKENTTFKNSSWNEKEMKNFKDTFFKLDEGIYLIKKPVVIFTIMNTISLDDNDDSEGDISDIGASDIFNDIKDQIKTFDKYGEKNIIFSILVREHWYQCWEGDYDCSIEYAGVINEVFEPDTILTKKSKENRDENKKYEKMIDVL